MKPAIITGHSKCSIDLNPMRISLINQGPHLLVLQDEVCFKSIRIYLDFLHKMPAACIFVARSPTSCCFDLGQFPFKLLTAKPDWMILLIPCSGDWIQLRYNSCMRLTDHIRIIHRGGNMFSERLVCSNNRHRELNAWSARNREINRRDENKSVDGLKRRLSAAKCTLLSKRCAQTLITSQIALSVLLSSFYNLPLSCFH